MAWIVRLKLTSREYEEITDAMTRASLIVVALDTNDKTIGLIDSVEVIDALNDLD